MSTEFNPPVFSQLALRLTGQPEKSLENFVEPGNSHLVLAIRKFLDHANELLLYLAGPKATGKTHLLLAAAQNAGDGHGQYLTMDELVQHPPEVLDGMENHQLLCIDNIELVRGHTDWQVALFHLFNRCQATKCKWLVAAHQVPSAISFGLPDLQSRLGWGVVLRLPELSEELRLRVLKQQADHFGLELREEVQRYLIKRSPRDLSSLTELLYQLERRSLAEKRGITIPFIKACFGW